MGYAYDGGRGRIAYGGGSGMGEVGVSEEVQVLDCSRTKYFMRVCQVKCVNLMIAVYGFAGDFTITPSFVPTMIFSQIFPNNPVSTTPVKALSFPAIRR